MTQRFPQSELRLFYLGGLGLHANFSLCKRMYVAKVMHRERKVQARCLKKVMIIVEISLNRSSL